MPFTFEISLSVLNHLGRNLYRSFATVLGEAISNAWDADAVNVKIYIDSISNDLVIKDDGIGMTADDFQEKFLKIGYSKRKGGESTSEKGRPFIGRKGIGKLALLSCADRIAVISKVNGGDYVGGVIDNSDLDQAITEDLTPQEYQLENYEKEIFSQYTSDHEHGTIIRFENIKDGIKNTEDFFKRVMALYFRFSLLDDSFNVFINEEKITLDHLDKLAQKTQFLWNINNLNDPYISEKLTDFLKEEVESIQMNGNVKGFIASVDKPRNLKILTIDERVGIDLFVNGRLRERDILKHIPTARLAENYFYGQIHFDDLDDEKDRFTSSREGIIADDPKYKDFLEIFRKSFLEVLETWDKLRRKHRKDGDPDDQTIPIMERKAGELYNAVSEEFDLPKDSKNKQKIDDWIDGLQGDAKYNLTSYAECFISENLIRKYIEDKNIKLSQEEKDLIERYKKRENENKKRGNLSIDLRNNDDLSYLDLDLLAKLVDPQQGGPAYGVTIDAKQYKPVRDALMHTALLSDEAKQKLISVSDNIKGRIKKLLSSDNNQS